MSWQTSAIESNTKALCIFSRLTEVGKEKFTLRSELVEAKEVSQGQEQASSIT